MTKKILDYLLGRYLIGVCVLGGAHVFAQTLGMKYMRWKQCFSYYWFFKCIDYSTLYRTSVGTQCKTWLIGSQCLSLPLLLCLPKSQRPKSSKLIFSYFLVVAFGWGLHFKVRSIRAIFTEKFKKRWSHPLLCFSGKQASISMASY